MIDYVLYLSIRGESERALMDEAAYYPEEDFEDEDVVEEFEDYAADIVGSLAGKWERTRGGSAVVMPITPRVEPTEQSIERGRDLFLGIVPGVSLQCVGCHGPQALGNGSSWIDPETFDRHVFTYDPDDPRTDRAPPDDRRGRPEKVVRRVGRPAPAGEPAPRHLQGGASPDRPLLADRRRHQGIGNAGARLDPERSRRPLAPRQLRPGPCPTAPTSSDRTDSKTSASPRSPAKRPGRRIE